MVDKGQALPCIPSTTQGLSNCFHRRDESAKGGPEGIVERSRRANIIKRAKGAPVPSKSVTFRGSRRYISPGSARRPRPVSFPCSLPRLSFGEALPDADDLFSSASGWGDLEPLPIDQTDPSMDTQRQQAQVDGHHEEEVSQDPVENARPDDRSPNPRSRSPLHQTQNAAFLGTCIREMMAIPERRPVGRKTNGFDEREIRPAPLFADRAHDGSSLFLPPRQCAGNTATPVILHSHLDVEHTRTKGRLDSSDVQMSVSHQVSKLGTLEEEICRDSGAYVPGQEVRLPAPSDRDKARAEPMDRSGPHDTSALKGSGRPLPDEPEIPLPLDIKTRSPSPPSPSPSSPSSSSSSRPASLALPQTRIPGPTASTDQTWPRTYKPSNKTSPKATNRPQNSPSPSSVELSCSPPPPERRHNVSPVDAGPRSRPRGPDASPSPPPIPPRNPARLWRLRYNDDLTPIR